MILFSELDKQDQEQILPKLRPYFDQITIENKDRWIMLYYYGENSIYQSFETTEIDPYHQEKAFERHKLALFLDGVYLFYAHSIEHIELICNAYDAKHLYR